MNQLTLSAANRYNAAMDIMKINAALVRDVSALGFGPPVAYVYNPLVYARAAHRVYLERYGTRTRRVILLGMNPGPWGMAQTGVPFGEVSAVRDWLGIEAPVGKPPAEHPKRPILGFDCQRSEVSGARLWGWAKEKFRAPRRFFNKFFVANYCPLVFMDEGGRNVTPDKLQAAQRQPLLEACDKALRRMVDCLEPRYVIGVGAFARKRAQVALMDHDVTIGGMLHPSPASPLANRGWAQTATKQLEDIGIRIPASAKTSTAS